MNVGKRHGVHGAGAAGDHDRMVVSAVNGPDGDPSQLQPDEDVGVGQLVLERDADDIEFRQREVRFEAGERPARRAELLLVVRPGRENALAGRVVPAVQDLVQDPEAQVRHADLVGIGEEEADLCPHGRKVLVHAVDLVVDVPGRLGHQRQKIFEHGTPCEQNSEYRSQESEFSTKDFWLLTSGYCLLEF